MMEHWFAVSLLLAFLSLDVEAAGQIMVSRPIVTGPLVGWLMGHPAIGLEMGALIELIWIGDLSVGAHLPIDLTVLAGISSALACELVGGKYPPEAAMTYAMAVAIPLAVVGVEVEVLVRKLNVRWVHLAQRMAQGGHFVTFAWINWLVLLELLVKGFLVMVAGLALAHWSGGLFRMLPGVPVGGKVMDGLYYAHWLLLALGCSAVIDMLVEKKTSIYLGLSIATMMGLAMFSSMQGIYLISIALCAGFAVALIFVGKEGASPSPADERREGGEKAPSAVNKWDLFQVFFRSFFLQTLWNYERYLSYGVAFALQPVLTKAYPSKEERGQALSRHLEYFNTHPYMASFILGAVVKMEDEKQQLPRPKQKQKEDEISALKVGMMGPVAAMGDNLFWATIRPYCGLIGATLVFSKTFEARGPYWIIPVLFLLVYNVAHIGIRAAGFVQGYRQGDQVVLALRKYGFQQAIYGLRLASIMLLGVLIVFVNIADLEKRPFMFLLKLAFFTAIAGLFTFALHRKISPSQLFYAVVLFALMLAFWPAMSAPPAVVTS